MAGIVGYGAYIPRQRIKVEEIAKVWGADAPSYKKGLMLQEKSVPAPDQDVITMSVEAAKKRPEAGAASTRKESARIYIGSESHPYAVKPSGTVVAEAIGAVPESTARTSSSPARRAPRACSWPTARQGGLDEVRPRHRRGHSPGRPRRRARVLRGGRRGGVHHRQG